jgi:hypothetical protein
MFLPSLLCGENNRSVTQIKKDIKETSESISKFERHVRLMQINDVVVDKEKIDKLIDNFRSCNFLLQRLSDNWRKKETTINDIQHVRYDMIVNWLLYWKILSKFVDINHDFSATIQINIMPDTSLNPDAVGIYIAGMAPESIKDPFIRKDYEEKIKKNKFLLFSRRLQTGLLDIKKQFIRDSHDFFINTYSQSPSANEELLELLEKYDYPEEEKIKVLKTLRIPYQSFREWQSKDGQIKVTAKYISFDGQNVTLETKDKKRETIIFSNLQEEDQKYVREQTNEKKEKR